MATMNEEHVQRLAQREHNALKRVDAVMNKYKELRKRYSGVGRAIASVESAAGAVAGGAIEGRTGGATVMKVPLNLGIGALLLAGGYLLAGRDKPDDEHWASEHLNNVGNGLVNSYFAALGYAGGKRWKDTGKFFGGSEHLPWSQPFGEFPPPPSAVHGDLTEAQMAEIVHRMQAAAAAPHPG